MNINKKRHNDCSSCGLCKVCCPHDAIAFNLDNDGFYKSTISIEKCADCNICTKVCYKYLPAKEPFENAFKYKSVYGTWSKNLETVKATTSGGIGYELTKHFFEKGYKICGCIFDAQNDACKHIIAKTPEDLEVMKTSKYLQSNTVEAFAQFKKDEKYLVIGTPCQIDGLRKYIQVKKWEDNFILVDFFCHGTPSFNLWKKYKEYVSEKHALLTKFTSVNFREKNLESKWCKNAISIRDFTGRQFVQNRAFSEDLFFKFFLNESCLNESCYQCKLRLDHCAADIRLADFWGKKYANNEWGVSLVIANTEKGQQSFDEITPKLEVEKCSFEDLQDSQGKRFIFPNKKRELVLKELQGEKSLEEIYRKHFGFNDWWRKTIVGKGTAFVKRILRKIYAN